VHVELKLILKWTFEGARATSPIMDFNVFLYFDGNLRASLKGEQEKWRKFSKHL
jgi:hypothetical protein